MNTGDKTAIDYSHTATSQQLQWLLFTFRKLFEARYETLMATQKERCQDTREKELAEL